MMKWPMSPAAAGLVRALLTRAAVARESVLLTRYRSTDWQSLTFEGERHEIGLRVTGATAQTIVDRVIDGIAEVEFTIPGHFVADISVREPSLTHEDGSVSLELEALTIGA